MLRHLVAAALLLAPAGALADSWTVDKEASTVGFSVTQMGSAIGGVFHDFDADIDFDPTAPENAKVRAVIDLASIDSRNEERDRTIVGPDWFDTGNHPEAVFESAGARALGGSSYEFDGTLTLRGHGEPVTLPATVEIDGDMAHATGQLVIDRNIFGVGQGDWASDKVVGLEVTVTIDIHARRTP